MVDTQQPSAREKEQDEKLRDTRILFSCTRDDFRYVCLITLNMDKFFTLLCVFYRSAYSAKVMKV